MKVYFHDGVMDDLKALPSAAHREVAVGWIQQLSHRPELGQPCGWRSSTGDLGDCLKLYFDHDDEPQKISFDTRRQARYYRIVLRVHEDRLEVVAVGPGHPPPAQDAVYVVAGQRLGRIVPARGPRAGSDDVCPPHRE